MKPTTVKQPSVLRNIVVQYTIPVWSLIWKRASDKSRRMCYLASLYAYLTGCDEDDIERLSSVNKVLHLSRDDNALRFPAMIAPMIWRIKTNRLEIKEGRVDQQVGRLLRLTPCWLLYGDTNTMRADLHNLLQLCSVQSKYNIAA